METTTMWHGRLIPGLKGCALGAGLFALFLGLVVIYGWYTGNATLVQILPTFVPMQFNTALCFVFCGIGLILLVYRRYRIAIFPGLIAAAIGCLTLVEYIAVVDLGIDQLLMEHTISVATSHPGRMAPNTAICFMLIGLGIVLRRSSWSSMSRSMVRVVFSSLTLGLALVAFAGYFTSLKTAYAWGDLTHMSLHSSIGLILLGSGLLCLVWSRDIKAESWLPRWIPVPITVVILTATFSMWQAMLAAAWRLKEQSRVSDEILDPLENIARVGLGIGIMLAGVGALAAFLAQRNTARTRQLRRMNEALQSEIGIRQKAEAELKQHQDHLEELVEDRTCELDKARLEAEAANRAKSDFLSHMSHELRTPLNGILGYAQILQRDAGVSTTQGRHLDSIFNCGDHLLSLINDVLDLSRIEAGRMDVDSRPLDFYHLIDGVKDIVQGRARKKGLTFEAEIASDVPRGLVSDAAKIRQILVNLLGNSVKFTNSGGVVLNVKLADEEVLEIHVIDTGPGIGAEDLDIIFDPFQQTETGRAAGGTGLGLAITMRLVQAMGGTINVESEKGRGSDFWFTLPLVRANEEELEAIDPVVSPDDEFRVLAPGQKCKILVADDRETNRDVIQGMLDGAGFETILANDGEEALQLLQSGNQVDLVLMDMRMPRLDGEATLQHIRADAQLQDLKVIAVTASVFPEFRDHAIEAGFNDFLGKPFRVDELMDVLQGHLPIEFTTISSSAGNALETHGDQLDEKALTAVPAELVARLRDALRIKNMTAIKSTAEALIDDPETAAAGKEIGRLIAAFDFTALENLLTQME